MVMPKLEFVCKYDFEGFKTFIELKIYTNGKKATTLKILSLAIFF